MVATLSRKYLGRSLKHGRNMGDVNVVKGGVNVGKRGVRVSEPYISRLETLESSRIILSLEVLIGVPPLLLHIPSFILVMRQAPTKVPCP